MGKIIGSWLLKVHLHGPGADDEGNDAGDGPLEVPTNDQVKEAVIAGIQKELGGEATVSLVERTDD